MGHGQSFPSYHVLEVQYPTTLSCDVEAVKPANAEDSCAKDPEVKVEGNVVRISSFSRDDRRDGCGATIVFQRNVESLRTTFTCKKAFTPKSQSGCEFKVGQDVQVWQEAKAVQALKGHSYDSLAVTAGITKEEATEYFVETAWKVVDKLPVSRLHIYHHRHTKKCENWVSFKWLTNDLHLKPDHEDTFVYQGDRVLKVHPEDCKYWPIVEKGIVNRDDVSSRMSPLCMTSGTWGILGETTATVSISFDGTCMDDGVYVGKPSTKRASSCESRATKRART